MTKGTVRHRLPKPRVHRPELTLPPKPHSTWQELDPDVRVLLCKIIQVAREKPYLIRCWNLDRNGKPHADSFLRKHVPATGMSEVRARRALARAIKLRLIARPNPKGGKQRLPSKDDPGPEDYYVVDGDYVYITALGYKVTRSKKFVAPIMKALSARSVMTLRAFAWGVSEWAKQFTTPNCQLRFPTPNDRRELEHRLSIIAMQAHKQWSDLSESDRAAIDLIFTLTLGPGAREAWTHHRLKVAPLGGVALLLRAHDLERLPESAVYLHLALQALSFDGLNGQIARDEAGQRLIFEKLAELSAKFDTVYRKKFPPEKDLTVEDRYHELVDAVEKAMRDVQEQRKEERRRAESLQVDNASRTVAWKGSQLNINAHADFTILACLATARGTIVSYGSLLGKVKPTAVINGLAITQGPPEVREAVQHINRALAKTKAPFEVKSVRSKGYRLVPTMIKAQPRRR